MLNLDQIDPQKPVLIFGPTASGKSGLALDIAQEQGGIIVNADALQVYQGWPLLTAQPPAQDLAQAAHHLYGHLPFDDSTTVESPIVRGPGDTGELMPRYGFRVRTGAGAMHTFACPPPSSEDDKARFDSHDWVQAIRTVVEQRTAPVSASASPMATPMK